MSDSDLSQLLVSLTVVLVIAHLCGYAAQRLYQPRVAGELLGGLLLGPTVLGFFAPGLARGLVPEGGPVAGALHGIEDLGMLMLMFLAGTEVRRLLPRGNRRVVVSIVAFGMIIPFAVALIGLRVVDLSMLTGPAQSRTAIVLIIASAITVTSIPVISRIMLDLGILNTSFARIVLAVAIAEDVVLYVVISVALGLARSGQTLVGLPQLLGLEAEASMAVYYVVATVAFLFVAVVLLPKAATPLFRQGGVVGTLSGFGSTTLCITLTFALASAASTLGVQPMFGSFVAGILVARMETGTRANISSQYRSFAVALFLPLYFAAVGLDLDLINNLDIVFTVLLLAIASVVKLLSVYVGGRIGGQSRWPSVHLAVALNARGGPGIVLANLAYDAGIVNAEGFTALILLAVGTSLIAGGLLRVAVDRGSRLTDDEEPSEARATT